MHIIANWKMNLTYEQEILWVQEHRDELIELLKLSEHNIVEQKQHANCINITLCPSFLSLAQIAKLVQGTKITVGAQTCSTHLSGAYTGQISAVSLKNLGVTYALVGHSEERALGVSDELLVQKFSCLVQAGITPIVCVGESKVERDTGKTKQVITEQLMLFRDFIYFCKNTHKTNFDENLAWYIAYEPIWAIGTGAVPTAVDLQNACNTIHDLCPTARILYGGSVSETTVSAYTALAKLGGFLVGSASLDFKQLKKLVQLLMCSKNKF